jgi:nucleolar complex protein 2
VDKLTQVQESMQAASSSMIGCCLLQELQPLMYPLSQVLIGAVKLVPTPRYFLLHLRLLRALVKLEAASHLLLPLLPLLLDVLR